MSELSKLSAKKSNLRSMLLVTASGAALLAAACSSTPALASNDDRPVIWIEVGGEFVHLEDAQQAYVPPFLLGSPPAPFVTETPASVEKNPSYSWDGNAKLAFEPDGSDWVFAAAVQYGRNTADRSFAQRTPHPAPNGRYGRYGYYAYNSVTAKSLESHMILDFTVGKDVGLGMFGSSGSSVVSAGVRYAQFNSRNSAGFRYRPTNDYFTFDKFAASFAAARKFSGVGPSLSWDASTDLIGNQPAGRIAFDWGVNGAVLFGRQRISGHHQATETAMTLGHGFGESKFPVYNKSGAPTRNKQVTVPDLGGFAGVSWRYPNAKISLGYRADFFFGAMDGGIDTARKENQGFFGPFASVSIGIGG